MNLLIKISLTFLIGCSTNKPIVSNKSFDEILMLHQKNGGSTYCFHLDGNMQHTRYFAIGVFPQLGLELNRSLRKVDLENFAETNSKKLSEGYCLGTWINEKKVVYIDVVKILPLSEGRVKAIKIARKHKQVAIYNLFKDTVIEVPAKSR
jgi:hypothetical protein